MVGTKVDESAQGQAGPEQTQMHGDATVVPPRIEVAEDRRGTDEDFEAVPSQISVRGLNFFYGKEQALFDNEIEIKQHRVTAVIGPSGCGKSTHIRTYNRIFNLYRDQKAAGEIMMDGDNILSSQTDLLELRRKIGMIFQKPSPFPMTVFDNVAYGLRQHYKMNRAELTDRVEHCSAIDPVATAKIEDLVLELKSRYTIVLVTHNMQQAARVSDYTAFFFQGRIVEFGPTTQIFSNPAQKQTEEYITGRFG